LNGEHTGLFGDKLKRVETKASHEVEKAREGYEGTHESDIRFINRVLIDKFDTIPEVPLRVHYMDIETNESLDVLTTPEPIICISVFDNFLGVYNTFVWRDDQSFIKEIHDELGNLGEPPSFRHNKFYFNNEKEMLTKWIEFTIKTDPDIFAGYNLLGFDWIYIINRCQRLGLKLDSIAHANKTIQFKMREPWNDVIIPGRYVFDILRAYKESKFKELDDNSLNSVAKAELQDEKIEVEDFTNVWKTDLPKLIERCRKDVELCMKIDKKSGLLDYYDTMRREVGCRWEDLWNTTFFHDITFLREAKLQGVKLPRNPHSETEKTKGGLVHSPPPGLHKNIIVLDLKSLYPYIIQTFNISPECIDPLGGDISINTHWGIYRFSLEKPGLCSIVVKKLLKKRVYYKSEMKQFPQDSPEHKSLWWKQEAVKRMANKVYGALGNSHFRLYKIECARAITSIGQEINKFSCEQVKKFNDKLNVIYGDTDSIFVKCPDEWDKDECAANGLLLSFFITGSYQEFVDKHFTGTTPPKSLFEIDFQCVYTEMFFRASSGEKVAKKRYFANKWSKNSKGEWEFKYEVKGFETIRSDSAVIEKDTFNEINKLILKGTTYNEVKSILLNVKNKCIKGEVSLDDVSIRRGVDLTKEPDVYTYAAKYGNAHLGCKFKNNTKIKMLYMNYVPNSPLPPQKGDKAIAFQHIGQLEKVAPLKDWYRAINWNKMFERLFDTKMHLIEKSMGWDETSKQGKQMTLF